MGRLLSYPELKSEKGIRYSRVHIGRLVKAKKFPKPLKPSGSPTGINHWDEREIDEFLEARAAERNRTAA
jgi:predicted DNA-binding transcriptional regulator AlpA